MSRVLAPGALLLVGLGLLGCEMQGDRDSQRPMVRDAERGARGYAETPNQRTDDVARIDNQRLGQQDSRTGTGAMAGNGTGAMAGNGTAAGNGNGTQDQVTPTTQGNNAADLETTRVIRRALLDNDQLSVATKNLTIVTNNQVVTLKGTVPSATEHVAAVAAAHAAAGKNRVDDQIVIDASKTADSR